MISWHAFREWRSVFIYKRHGALVKRKKEGVEKNINKLWICVNDHHKKTDARLKKIEEKVELNDFSLGVAE